MVLRMKNFNILGVYWKIQLLGVGGSQKTNIEGGIAWKGGLDSLGLAKKSRRCFRRGADTTMHTMSYPKINST